MMELRCREMIPDCETVIRGEDENEVLHKAAEHVRQEHYVDGLSEEQIRDVRSRIRIL